MLSLNVFGVNVLTTLDCVSPSKPRRDEAYCVKLLSQRLSARNSEPQVAAIQIRAAILISFTVLVILGADAIVSFHQRKANMVSP